MDRSQFLPDAYDEEQPLALIAGRGQYPIEVLQATQAAGARMCLVAFEGETAQRLVDAFAPDQRVQIKVGQVGKLIKALKAFEAPYALMAGQITPGRLFRGLHPDLRALRLLMQVKQRNAESLFRALADELEREGTRLLDARCFLDQALATKGVLHQGKWVPQPALLEQGVSLARTLAAQDIGQGLVIDRHGTVLAVEAFEGTDAMLERAGQFGAKHTLFIKTVKPQQDYRFDVPVFGPRTVERMHAHGIQAAALASKGTLILDKAQTLQLCQSYKLSLIGV